MLCCWDCAVDIIYIYYIFNLYIVWLGLVAGFRCAPHATGVTSSLLLLFFSYFFRCFYSHCLFSCYSDGAQMVPRVWRWWRRQVSSLCPCPRARPSKNEDSKQNEENETQAGDIFLLRNQRTTRFCANGRWSQGWAGLQPRWFVHIISFCLYILYYVFHESYPLLLAQVGRLDLIDDHWSVFRAP